MSDNHKIPKLNVNNYDVWKLRMKAYLITKELWGVIDGSAIFPNTPAGNTLKNKTEASAQAELVLALYDKRLVAVAQFNLQGTFGLIFKKNMKIMVTNTVFLICELFTTKMPEGGNMDDNVAHIDSIFNKLTAQNVGVTDLMEAVALLISCPDSFGPTVSALEVQHIKNPLKYEDVKSAILGEANKRKSITGVSGGDNHALNMAHGKQDS